MYLRSKAEAFISVIIAGQQAHLPNNILMPPHSLWLRDLLKGPSPLILSEWPSSHGDEQQLPLLASHHTSTHQHHTACLQTPKNMRLAKSERIAWCSSYYNGWYVLTKILFCWWIPQLQLGWACGAGVCVIAVELSGKTRECLKAGGRKEVDCYFFFLQRWGSYNVLATVAAWP